MNSVEIYDHSTIDTFNWPQNEEGKKAKEYLTPLIKQSVDSFIGNVTTKIYLVASNQCFLPITVNEAEYDNSYVASNYYGLCFYDEIMSLKHPIFSNFQRPFLKFGKWILQKVEINKCIFLNNWLMTNSISSDIDKTEMKKIVSFLKERFPKHVIIYRNLDNYSQKKFLKVLKASQFHLLKIRDVFLYDPAKKGLLSKKALSHHRKDRKILEKYEYSIERHFEEKDIETMLALYNQVYCLNHTSYSPQYTVKFLRNILENEIFKFIGLKREGRLEGIVGFFIRNETMITSFFGFDRTVPHSDELYRILSLLILEEAENANVVLNDGSGGEKTKKYRGMVPYPEFMGIYHHHLPILKRLFWNLLSNIYRFFVKTH